MLRKRRPRSKANVMLAGSIAMSIAPIANTSTATLAQQKAKAKVKETKVKETKAAIAASDSAIHSNLNLAIGPALNVAQPSSRQGALVSNVVLLSRPTQAVEEMTEAGRASLEIGRAQAVA